MSAGNQNSPGWHHPQGLTFIEHLRAEALRRPEIRAFVAEILADLREWDTYPLWAQYLDEHRNLSGREIHKTGVSEVGLYWRVWRIEDRPDGFEALCWRCAPLGEVEQLIQDVRPAHARDFMYLESLPPTCARCGWRNDAVHAARDKAHAAERAWRAKGAGRG